MKEEFRVVAYGIKYVCDNCKEGEMLSTGKNIWSQDPPLFEHACTKCEKKDLFVEKYPVIKFRPISS